MLAVQPYIQHFLSIWEESPGTFPVFERLYSEEEQNAREANFIRFQEKTEELQSKKNLRALKEGDPGQSFFQLFRSFLEKVFDFLPAQLDIILSDSFLNVSKDFFYRARAFDPRLSPESIYQGIRNVWIMNGLQRIMDLPVEITPSVFAYSMIYPYSDNFLDDPEISSEDKQVFSMRFNRRLHGEDIGLQNHAESQLFRLAGMFEDQFPRNEYPLVYESLYAIQSAQTRSLKLIDCNATEEDAVREICFEKGGASVLADGYLVAGHLNMEQERALFGYGVYLQLLDDIQDVKEDTDAYTKTLFSCRSGTSDMGAFVNRTIHFGRKAMEELRCFNGVDMELMLRLMNNSIENMIVESVGLNPQSYTEDYLRSLEKHSPLRFDFIRQKRSQSKSQRFMLFKKYFGQVPVAGG